MVNGAEFIFTIPGVQRIEQERFAEDVEFPFAFDEIERLFFYKKVRVGPVHDIEAIDRALAGIEGIRVTKSTDGIEVKLADGSDDTDE